MLVRTATLSMLAIAVLAPVTLAQDNDSIIAVECSGLRSVYTYSLAGGAIIFDDALLVALIIDTDRGEYSYLDEAGAPGEMFPIHGVSEHLIILRDEALGGDGIIKNDHRAEFNTDSFTYKFASDLRHEDGTEDIRIGEATCQRLGAAVG